MPVNVNNDKYSIILGMLRDSAAPLSGEHIAENLGISRVAVWKLLNRLRETGYGIESSRSGYRLLKTTEKPVPWELDDYGFVEYFNELDSTMARAEKLIDSGCADGTTVIAGKQNSGLRYDGGRWQSPDGGLYFTRIRRRPFPARFCGFYPAVLCLSVVEHLQNEYEIDAEYSWPCRVAAGGKIIAGVLTDSRVRNGLAEVSSAGFGLNVSSSEDKLPPSAASIESIAGAHIPVKELLNGLLERLGQREEAFFSIGDLSRTGGAGYGRQSGDLRSDCLVNGRLKGKRVRTSLPGSETVSGEIIDIDFSGSLIIRAADGAESYIHPGEAINYE